jgi:hypothetical protein
MLKLYRSYRHQGAWVAYSSETGWVIFPETENGWEQRKPAKGLDPMHLRQMPIGMAASTGIQSPVEQKCAA